MKVEVTEKYLVKILEQLKQMRDYGSHKDYQECQRLIANTNHYLKKRG